MELAAALDVSHVAARALLTRARESLRRALAEEEASEATRDGSRGARAGDSASGGPAPGGPADGADDPDLGSGSSATANRTLDGGGR